MKNISLTDQAVSFSPINTNSMKPNYTFFRITKVAAAVGCISIGGFVFQAAALSLTFDQVRFLGEIERGPGSATKEEQSVDRLADMSPGTMFRVAGRTYARSGNLFDPLPEAEFAGSGKRASTGIVLDGTYEYLLVRDSPAASRVWYVGGLSGHFDLPAIRDQHNGISHYSLFRGLPAPAAPPAFPPAFGAAVSDAGFPLSLLGAGVLSLTLFHRKLRKPGLLAWKWPQPRNESSSRLAAQTKSNRDRRGKLMRRQGLVS